jgi:oxygen-independent coproporphyrinogen-3 oxidase
VYVHVPFCDVRCPYCHFACFVNRIPGFELRYVRALRREFEASLERFGELRLASVYFGGGTPSALPPEARAELCQWVDEELRPRLEPGAEVTLEANPESLDREGLRDWVGAGVNRLSIGVQSMEPRVLEFLGRLNTPQSNLAALELACTLVENVSADLIVASPEDAPAALQRSVQAITSFPVSHLSAYLLEIHPDTRFGRDVQAGRWSPMPSDRQAELYLELVSGLEARGFEAYELSNFAQPGRESRHNQRYWTRDAYLGLGPSAHSFRAERRWWNLRDAGPWCEALESGASAVDAEETLDRQAIRTERILLGLRRRAGVPEEWLSSREAFVDECVRAGWLRRGEGRVAATVQGWLLLDELLPRLCDPS